MKYESTTTISEVAKLLSGGILPDFIWLLATCDGSKLRDAADFFLSTMKFFLT
jgi:hypothetical protein